MVPSLYSLACVKGYQCQSVVSHTVVDIIGISTSLPKSNVILENR